MEASSPRLTLAPLEGELRDEALSWPERAKAIRITTPATYGGAVEILKGIKQLAGKISDSYNPHIAKAHELHRGLCGEKAAALAPLNAAESIIKAAMVTWNNEQEQLRLEEESRLRAEARRDAERRQLDTAAALEREAIATGDLSLLADAHQLLGEHPDIPVIAPATATPAIKGVAFRQTWTASVTDLQALVKHIAAHPEFMSLVTVNQKALVDLVRATGGKLTLPGVSVATQSGVAIRSSAR